jgi:hypothetical protein
MPLLHLGNRRYQQFCRPKNAALFAALAQRDEVLLCLNSEELQEVISLGFKKAVEVIFQRRAELKTRGLAFIQDKGTALWNTRYADAVRATIPQLVISETPAERRISFWEKSHEGKQWAAGEPAWELDNPQTTTAIRSSSGPSTIAIDSAAYLTKLHKDEASIAAARTAYEEVLSAQKMHQDAAMVRLLFTSSSPTGHELLYMVAGRVLVDTNEIPCQFLTSISIFLNIIRITNTLQARFKDNADSDISPPHLSPLPSQSLQPMYAGPMNASTSVSSVKTSTRLTLKNQRVTKFDPLNAGEVRAENNITRQGSSRNRLFYHNRGDFVMASSNLTSSSYHVKSVDQNEGCIGVAQPTKSTNAEISPTRKKSRATRETRPSGSEKEDIRTVQPVGPGTTAGLTNRVGTGLTMRILVMCTRGCARGFATQEMMERHVRNDHDGSKDYICHLCEEQFSKNFQLLRHIRQNHSKR